MGLCGTVETPGMGQWPPVPDTYEGLRALAGSPGAPSRGRLAGGDPRKIAALRAGQERIREQYMLDLKPEVFREHFNSRHFVLHHQLTGHPLFELPRLIELARDTAAKRPDDLYY